MTTAGSIQPNDDFYDAAPVEPHLLYQGEILVEVPILNMPMPARWLLLRTKSGDKLDEALKHGLKGGLARGLDSNQSTTEWYNATDGDFAMGRLTKRPVLVLSQTCDIQNKDFVQIAPIFPAAPEDVERLRSGNELYSAFFLKGHPSHFPDSYADLELMQAVHKSYIKRNNPKHFRLKDEHVRELQRHFMRFRTTKFIRRIHRQSPARGYLPLC